MVPVILREIYVSSLYGRVYREKKKRQKISDCFLPVWEGVSNHSNLDFSELDHRRVGVQYKLNGIVINYNGAYQEKRLWKYIRMSFADIAAEVEKRIA